MKLLSIFILPTTLLATVLSFSSISAEKSLLIDDFKHESSNKLGLQRLFMTDVTVGGQSKSNVTVNNGVIEIKGEIVPPRGQPGWSSSVLPLASMGEHIDASGYQGIQLRLKVNSGSLIISANSSEVTNFDYHAAPIPVAPNGKFHEIKVPFADMKRAWSEQSALNTATLASLSIVAISMQNASYDFAVDKVSFY